MKPAAARLQALWLQQQSFSQKNLFIDGVDDSKKLSARKREELFSVISQHAVSIGVGIIDHNVIDRINILQATHLAMRKALESLAVKPDYVLVDGNSFKHETLRFQNIIGGDAKSFTIAAASIIAKVTRDRLMCELDVAISAIWICPA